MYKSFFRNLFIVILLLCVTDFFVGNLFEYFYRTSRYGIFGRQVYCLSKSNENIIILGPSTAAHHYVPSILSDSLGMTCFNAGSDGMTVYYHYGLLTSYKSDRKPKAVIYDLNITDWYKSRTSTFTLDAALDRFAPHYGETREIDSLFAINGFFEKVKLISLMYRYNSKLVQLIKCHFIPSFENAGYEALPLSKHLPEGTEREEENEDNNGVENLKVEYLQKLIDYTSKNGIQLIFVMSPRYNLKRESNYEIGKELAEKNHIPLIDLMNEPALMKPEYFADEGHLNDEGARKFTALLIPSLKNYINNMNL